MTKLPGIYYMVSWHQSESRGVQCLQLCYKDVCTCGMKTCNIDTDSWEFIGENRTLWKKQGSHSLKQGECHAGCCQGKEVQEESKTKKLLPQNHRVHLTSCVRAATDCVNGGMVSTATQEDVPQPTL